MDLWIWLNLNNLTEVTCAYSKPLNHLFFFLMHYTNISTLGRNSFCYCPFCFWDFLLTGSCCLSSKAGGRRCVRVGVPAGHVIVRYGGLLEPCDLGTCWSDAEWPQQNDWKMLCFSTFAFRITKKSISQHKYQGSFHFQPNRLLFSDTSCHKGSRVEERISIPTRKMDFLSTIAPVPVTLFSYIWLQNFPWISHGTKKLNIYQVSPAPNLKMCL